MQHDISASIWISGTSVYNLWSWKHLLVKSVFANRKLGCFCWRQTRFLRLSGIQVFDGLSEYSLFFPISSSIYGNWLHVRTWTDIWELNTIVSWRIQGVLCVCMCICVCLQGSERDKNMRIIKEQHDFSHSGYSNYEIRSRQEVS